MNRKELMARKVLINSLHRCSKRIQFSAVVSDRRSPSREKVQRGLRTVIDDYMADYMAQWYMRERRNGIDYGVPQGYVIGLTLLNAGYCRDVETTSARKVKILCFADDTHYTSSVRREQRQKNRDQSQCVTCRAIAAI